MSEFERLARKYFWVAGLMLVVGVVAPACTAEMMPTFPELEDEEQEGDDEEESS